MREREKSELQQRKKSGRKTKKFKANIKGKFAFDVPNL